MTNIINDAHMARRRKEKLLSDENFDVGDIDGLRIIDEQFSPKVVYYPGPRFDLAPIFYLSAEEYIYQDIDEITEPIRNAMKMFQETDIIENLKETPKITPSGSYPEFRFNIRRRPSLFPDLFSDGQCKSLLIDESDASKKLNQKISEADLVYAYHSITTGEMLQKAKIGSLILNHPSKGRYEEWIDDDTAKRYNLMRVILPLSETNFRGSRFFQKK